MFLQFEFEKVQTLSNPNRLSAEPVSSNYDIVLSRQKGIYSFLTGMYTFEEQAVSSWILWDISQLSGSRTIADIRFNFIKN